MGALLTGGGSPDLLHLARVQPRLYELLLIVHLGVNIGTDLYDGVDEAEGLGLRGRKRKGCGPSDLHGHAYNHHIRRAQAILWT